MKAQEKSVEKELNEMEARKLPEKSLKQWL